ncbi:MAG: hypothetical protein C4318_01305 [Acidimicrobiia bacterium]
MLLVTSLKMGIVQEFEERLERAVDRTVARLFRSGLQPVEILRRLARAQDLNKSVFSGRVVAPNVFKVFLSEQDFHRLAPIGARLREELSLALTRQAAREGWALLSPVEIELSIGSGLLEGTLEVHTEIQERKVSGKGILIAPDGQRIELEEYMLFGRATECDVVLQDTWCSRRHAEIKKSAEGYEIVDLNSTNGTFVNEEKIDRRVLKSGDALRLGRTTFRFVLV